MHHYFFCLCRIYAIIAIKNDFVINIGEVLSGVLKTEGYALGFQYSPRDLECLIPILIIHYVNYVPLRRGGGHIVFGVNPVCVCVGVAFCLHDIS